MSAGGVNDRLARIAMSTTLVLLFAAMTSMATPAAAADPVRDTQWHPNVVVGVVDTGVDATHPDLAEGALPGSVPSLTPSAAPTTADVSTPLPPAGQSSKSLPPLVIALLILAALAVAGGTVLGVVRTRTR